MPISLDTIVTVAALVLTLVSLHVANVRRFTRIETKMDMLWQWFEQKINKMNGG
jgi:hypothetical protein